MTSPEIQYVQPFSYTRTVLEPNKYIVNRMPKHLKDAWVNALRSGEFKQTGGNLYSDGCYCVMGVLGKVMGMTDDDLMYRGVIPDDKVKEHNISFPHYMRCPMVEVNGSIRTVININDGADFIGLSYLIESQVEGI
jgi:hypothetical protein